MSVSRPDVGIHMGINGLVWPPSVETSQGIQVNAIELRRTKDDFVVWASVNGNIYRTTKEGTTPVSNEDFTHLTSEVASAVQKIREAQRKELMVTEGRTVRWRPGHGLLEYIYVDEGDKKSEPKDVFVVRGELYCPSHNNIKLTTTYGDGENKPAWLACSDESCDWRVFLGYH